MNWVDVFIGFVVGVVCGVVGWNIVLLVFVAIHSRHEGVRIDKVKDGRGEGVPPQGGVPAPPPRPKASRTMWGDD